MYGNTGILPVNETATSQPISPYGVTKLSAEYLCAMYYRNFGVPTVSLRYFTAYGPRQRPDMAFSLFCQAILRKQPLRVFGDGTQTRDFTYVSDIVEANILAATSQNAEGKVLNIAGGSCVTILDVVKVLQEITGSKIAVVFENKQHGDVDHTFADTSLVVKVLKYHPQVSLYEGRVKEFGYFASLQDSLRDLAP